MALSAFIRFAPQQTSLTRSQWEQKAKADYSASSILEGAKTFGELVFFSFDDKEACAKYLSSTEDYSNLTAACKAAFSNPRTQVGEYQNGKPSVAVICNGYRARAFGVKGLSIIDDIALNPDKIKWGFCVQDEKPVWGSATSLERKQPQLYADISAAL